MKKYLPHGDSEVSLACKRPFERSFSVLEGGAFLVMQFLSSKSFNIPSHVLVLADTAYSFFIKLLLICHH